MDRNFLYVIAFFFIALIVVSGVIYFYSKAQKSMKEKEFGEFLFTINDLGTFLLIVFLIVIPIVGFLILKRK